MTKSELITALASLMNTSKIEAGNAFDAVSVTIASALKSGHDVPVTGVGILRTADKPARLARHPKTGDTIHVPAHKTVKFKPSKTLLDVL